MEQGIIRHWNDHKGYGFITPDDGSKDIFFHISTWQGEQRPSQNQRVYYRWTEKDGKRNATEVSLTPSTVKMSSSQRDRNPKQTKDPFKSPAAIIAMLIVAFLGAFTLWRPHTHTTPATNTSITQDAQLQQTLMLIQKGGPFPYPEHDGKVFSNREGKLPAKSRGYYHEYTVPTPGTPDRGARRIVTGGNPPEVYYYTTDHYQNFKRLEVHP